MRLSVPGTAAPHAAVALTNLDGLSMACIALGLLLIVACRRLGDALTAWQDDHADHPWVRAWGAREKTPVEAWMESRSVRLWFNRVWYVAIGLIALFIGYSGITT